MSVMWFIGLVMSAIGGAVVVHYGGWPAVAAALLVQAGTALVVAAELLP